MRRIIFCFLALFLVGCASSGTKVDPSAVAQFERGRTTCTQVVATLGRPNSETVNADGTRIIVYARADLTTRPETFIPIVGMFVGGADESVQSYSFAFDANGILASASSGNTQASGNMFGAHSRQTTIPAASAQAPPASAQTSQTNAPTPTSQRPCTQAEATQKRIAIQNGYSMIPNCQ